MVCVPKEQVVVPWVPSHLISLALVRWPFSTSVKPDSLRGRRVRACEIRQRSGVGTSSTRRHNGRGSDMGGTDMTSAVGSGSPRGRSGDLEDGEMWKAVKDCDTSCDGAFLYGVTTTGIYCRPSCASKLPERQNVVFLRTREEAEGRGFRPCKRCRPDLDGYDPAADYDHFHRQTGMAPARYRQIFAAGISRLVVDTPIGPLRITASSNAIMCVEQAGRELQDAGEEAPRVPADRLVCDDASGELAAKCKAELTEYFAGRRTDFDLPLAPEGTEFQKTVWNQLGRISYGQTRTYGELAAMLDNPKASRAVGMANHRNPILILIPCHRVIGADGSLTGYAAGVEAKKYLLDLEKRGVV